MADRRHDSPGPVDRSAVADLLAPVVATAGLDLEDVEIRSAGRRRIVRVLVDGDAGVSLDQVAEVSRTVSDALDESDVLGEQPYTLEVSSRGVDRPLTQPRHWRRNLGRLVTVVRHARPEVTGRVRAADAVGADLETAAGAERVVYVEVVRAVVQVEFRAAGTGDDPADDEPADDEAVEDEPVEDDAGTDLDTEA